jgi:tetratricopeptide (TPR) repeat protein
MTAAVAAGGVPKVDDFAQALNLQNSGNLAGAEAVYLRFLNKNPKHAGAHHNLGLIHLQRNEPALALPYLYFAVELNPRLAEAHNTLGNALLRLGRKVDAEAAYRKAVETEPRYFIAWSNLGNLQRSDNRPSEAEACYAKALMFKADYAPAAINLASIMRSGRRFNEALTVLEKAETAAQRSETLANNLGNAYRDLDRLEDAVKAYRKATAIKPDYAMPWLNLGTALTHLGRREEAIAALRRAIAIAPRYGDAYMQLVDVSRPGLADPIVADMQHYIADPATSASDRMHLAFALGRVHDANGSFEKAFGYFRQGNQIKRSTLNFDMEAERRFVASIKEVFSKTFMTAAQPSEVTDSTPIFILGMMRSGTTLMEQILASHPQVAGGDELPWIPDLTMRSAPIDGLRYPQSMRVMSRAELTRRGEKYIQLLRRRFGAAPRHVTDKLPGNFLSAGFISLALPQAKMIHMRRNPFDTCLSIYTTLFAELHHYAYDLAELGEFYMLYHGLMQHWDEVMPGRILHVNYENLVTNPEPEVRNILAFCGLEFDQNCLNFHQTERRVRTASANQVREKLHSRSIGRWRNYAQYLGDWKARFAGIAPDE